MAWQQHSTPPENDFQIKNANAYLDQQLIETFETMVDKANVQLYQSNKRPFQWDRWRYKEERSTHFYLEYRIVLHSCGGIECDWSGQKLSETACEFMQDLLTVARNLGFHCCTTDERLMRWSNGGDKSWRSNQLQTFYCRHTAGENEVLFEARAFKNRNIHLRLNQKFARALNVEFGRLKGWLATPQEAAEELKDPAAAACFGTHFALAAGNPTLLLKAA